MSFTPFDPLEFKNTRINDAALGALKREIDNILSSYVGWYDPFCELIQNSLDAVEARLVAEKSAGDVFGYQPKIDIRIDVDNNSLTVTDNGIGLDKEKFEQFLAPNFSFKSGKTRGHKGVGATYVAYGFNYLRISTKVPGFEASGRIVGARNWLKYDGFAGNNPKVEPDESKHVDDNFDSNDRGVSVTVRFDETTHPKRIDWIKADTAECWSKILSIKTGLGSVVPDDNIAINIVVIAKENITEVKYVGIKYLWLNDNSPKKSTLKTLMQAYKQNFEKYGPSKKMPDKFRNLDFIYDNLSSVDVRDLIGDKLDEEDLEILGKHNPTVDFEYGYTAKLWNTFNESLNLRGGGYRILNTGIQLGANNMPQGETIIVPLKRYTGRQNQVHFLIHFENYTPDLGRKGFNRELVDFAKSISQKLIDHCVSKYVKSLKSNTGCAPDLVREVKITEWKKDMLLHEESSPLDLKSPHFFLPIEKVSITSTPTREQDVIALFHQLIAGGVIRGIHAMSTNERFTYDGLFKISFEHEKQVYIYDEEKNPLGISEDVVTELFGSVTEPRVLEYKYCLDGLIEDLAGNEKNIKDIDLCVAWEIGEEYQEQYGITSLLMPENADQRQYHGVTHVLTDVETGAKQCDLIILKDLIEYLNDGERAAEFQRVRYE